VGIALEAVAEHAHAPMVDAHAGGFPDGSQAVEAPELGRREVFGEHERHAQWFITRDRGVERLFTLVPPDAPREALRLPHAGGLPFVSEHERVRALIRRPKTDSIGVLLEHQVEHQSLELNRVECGNSQLQLTLNRHEP
jgi:hypothetical protein